MKTFPLYVLSIPFTFTFVPSRLPTSEVLSNPRPHPPTLHRGVFDWNAQRKLQQKLGFPPESTTSYYYSLVYPDVSCGFALASNLSINYTICILNGRGKTIYLWSFVQIFLYYLSGPFSVWKIYIRSKRMDKWTFFQWNTLNFLSKV